jgi:MFS family permease
MPEASHADSAPLTGARLSLGLLLAINLLNYVDRQVLAAVEPQVAHEFFHGHENAHTLALMGSLGSAFFFSYMLAAPLCGWLADRVSRWLLVGCGVLLWSLATGTSGWAPTFAVLFACRLFVGIGEAGYGPAAPTIISDLYPVSHRGAVLSWFYVAIPVGSALGYIIGGAVGAKFGWRWAFYVVTLPGLVLGVWSLFMKNPRRGGSDRGASAQFVGPGSRDSALSPQPLPPASLPPAGGPRMAEYLKLASNHSYLLNTLAMAAMTFAIGGISFWMPRYLSGARGLDPAKSNMIFGGIVVVGGLAATLSGGWLGDRLRNRFAGSYFLVSGVGILLACPFLLAMLRTPFPAAWGMIFAAVFFLFFNTGPSNTALANVTHPSIRASAFALNIFMIHLLGDVPASPALGAIAGRWGWNATFGCVTVVMAIAGVLWLIGAPHLGRDTHAVAGSV